MKKYLFALLPVIAIIALLIWGLPHRQAPSPSFASETNLSQNVSQSTSNAPTSVVSTDETMRTPAEMVAARVKMENVKMDAEQRELNKWRTPIEFYGTVVDESNNVVSGVQVDFSCNDLSPTGTSDYHTVSDGNGLFSLKNVTGKLLVLNIAKSGYYTSKADNNSFEYGENPPSPSPNNPVLFHLHKKGEGADLIKTVFPVGIGQIAQLRHDGTPVEIDLINGGKAVGGNDQLKLEFWRDISDRNVKIFDWKLQISVVGGGLVETDEEFPFKAWDNGYQSPVVIDMQTNNPSWQGNVKSKYYLQLPDGKYGRIDFDFLPYNGVFTLKSWVNPSGSQNLEPR